MPKKLKADNHEVAFVKDPKINYVKRTHESAGLWKQASEIMLGGVTASIRYFEAYSIFVKRAKGARLFDVDSNEYMDYCLCLGPLILRHGHPAVVAAIKKQ